VGWWAVSLDLYITCDCCGSLVAELNATHNLRPMASAAGLETLWDPRPQNGLWLRWLWERGVAELIANPDKYRAMNPPNGWGTYEHLVDVAVLALEAVRRCSHGSTVRAST
jgi:hypothetical protein